MTIERIETVYGPMWIPDTDTHQYGWLKNIGASFEDIYIREVLKLLSEREPGVTLDIGACFGCWSLPLAEVSTKVQVFEPQDMLYRLLMRTFGETRNPEKFRLWNVAVGERSHVVNIPHTDLHVPANFGDCVVTEESAPGVSAVACLSVDDGGTYNFQPITFIKIDVQGMEAAVLRGAEITITRWRPLLFVEAHPDYADVEVLRAQITGWGYAVLPRGHNYLAVPL